MEVYKNNGEGRGKYYKQRQHGHRKDKVGIPVRYKALIWEEFSSQ
jgi:hypothetical protein